MEEINEFQKRYKDYLNSKEWKLKRELVIKRCNGICEGCGITKVEGIHHKTYKNFTNEFLFELYGLCKECHERLHAQECQSNSMYEVVKFPKKKIETEEEKALNRKKSEQALKELKERFGI